MDSLESVQNGMIRNIQGLRNLLNRTILKEIIPDDKGIKIIDKYLNNLRFT